MVRASSEGPSTREMTYRVRSEITLPFSRIYPSFGCTEGTVEKQDWPGVSRKVHGREGVTSASVARMICVVPPYSRERLAVCWKQSSSVVFP